MDKVAAAPMQDHDEAPFVEVRKEGSLIVDADDNVFSDLVSGWGAAPFGTTHERRHRRGHRRRRSRYGMEIFDYVQSDVAVEFAEKLVAIAPPGITRAMASLSGTLAVETGVKLARESTGRPMILVFHGQYHGEATYLTASVSSDLAEVNSTNSSYVGGLVFAPYPQQFRAPFHRGPGPYDDTLYMDFIEEWLLVHQVEPEQIAGVLIEPVLGRGRHPHPVRGVLGAAVGRLPALGLEADPRRGADGHGPLRQGLRLRVLGPASRHRAARQGHHRRRSADRRGAGHRGGHGRRPTSTAVAPSPGPRRRAPEPRPGSTSSPTARPCPTSSPSRRRPGGS